MIVGIWKLKNFFLECHIGFKDDDIFIQGSIITIESYLKLKKKKIPESQSIIPLSVFSLSHFMYIYIERAITSKFLRPKIHALRLKNIIFIPYSSKIIRHGKHKKIKRTISSWVGVKFKFL